MKTKLLLALMACMCVVSCKKDSDATNGADYSIYGVYDAVFDDDTSMAWKVKSKAFLEKEGKMINELEKQN